MSADPVLYSFRRCPYAMRGRMAISISGLRCNLREVVLRDKPKAMLDASPKGTVPVLVLPNGQVIEESLDVMMHALHSYDPEGWLRDDVKEDALALIAECDGPFKANLDRYKYPNRYDNVDAMEHRADGAAYLEKLEDKLAGNPYLMGPERSLADIAIFPFIRQFANTDRDWFDGLPLPGVQAWLERLVTSDLFLGIMKKYPQWHPGDAEPTFPPVP